MKYVLRCSFCNEEYDSKEHIYCCRKDQKRLEIVYFYEQLVDVIDKTTLEKRKSGVWKYAELLPVLDNSKIVSIGEGGTRLRRCDRLSEILGIKNLYAKDETSNPTGTFKDRPASVGVSKALEIKAETIVVASDGNVAPATAAYAMMAGVKCFVFVPNYMSPERITQTMMYGANVIVVKGDINQCIDLAIEIEKMYHWHHLTTAAAVNPYQMEGAKTIAYEISEQLGWTVPDWVIAPVGGGGILTANWKGFKEFFNLNLIDGLPKIGGIQASGCAPLVRAYREKRKPDEIKKWDKLQTIAIPIGVPFPLDGPTALAAIRESKGTAIAVSDKEIVEAQRLLAKTEAIIAEPAGAVTLAGTKKLKEEDVIGKDDITVFEVTGTGFKDLGFIATLLKKPPEIEPKIDRNLISVLGIN
ncbi:MAG: threonine synthase [Candidatus Hodarchaeota archaeon]